MGVDNLSQLYTCVDAANGVHPDLKSHKGGGMPFGYKLEHLMSKKVKYKTFY